MLKTDVKRGCGIANRFFCSRGGFFRHLGSLPAPHSIKGRLWNADNLWSRGECKSWTLDSGLDHGLDYGLEYGLNSRLIFKLLAMVASQGLY